MGIYAERINNTYPDVFNLVTEIFPGTITNIEIWEGYPLKNIGNLIYSSTDIYDIKSHVSDFYKYDLIIINGHYGLSLPSKRMLKTQYDKIEMEVCINLDHKRNDMPEFAWDIIYPDDEIDSRKLHNIILKNVFYKLKEILDIEKIVMGETCEVINLRNEPPYLIGIEYKPDSIKNLINVILPKDWKKNNPLTINITNLISRFLEKSSNLFYKISEKISEIHHGITASPGSIILEFKSEKDWENYKSDMREILSELYNNLPGEEEYFDRWKKSINKKLSSLK